MTPIEELVLRGLPLDFAVRPGEVLHRRVCRTRNRCGFMPEAQLSRVWSVRDTARDTFAMWIEWLITQLREAHPLSTTSRVARLVRAGHRNSKTLADYSREVHTRPSVLRRSFQKQFGMSIAGYRKRLRLLTALESVHTEKLDALALRVVYRSKKGFYAAFRQLTGFNPGAVRELPSEQVEQLIADLKRLVDVDCDRHHCG